MCCMFFVNKSHCWIIMAAFDFYKLWIYIEFSGDSDVDATPDNSISSKARLSQVFQDTYEALKDLNFGLLFLSQLAGVGTGLLVINNIGSLGMSLKDSNVRDILMLELLYV